MSGLVLAYRIGDELLSTEYRDVVELLRDKPLRCKFMSGEVADVSVWLDGKRLAGVPGPTWKRLVDALASNSAALIRAAAKQEEQP